MPANGPLDRLLKSFGRLGDSRFARDAMLLTGSSAFERVAALAQTVLIARALGIVEYGVYGLLFTSIGLVASVMGLQMGLTATVLVARYRENEKAKAGAVIRHVTRFAWLVTGVFWACSLPFAEPLSEWLLHSDKYAAALAIGCVFVGASLLSGVQDGIAQGFEDFRSIAVARCVSALLALALIWPAAHYYGLHGVIVAILAGLVVKMVMLQRAVAQHRKAHQIPRAGGDVRFLSMVVDFSLPSMLVSLLAGGVLWYGSFLLSRQQQGFESIAMVNIGLQWRGPILLIAASLGTVAVPIFSRHSNAEDDSAAQRFKRKLLWLNGIAALLAATALILCAGPLLALYGEGFQGGVWIFAALVATTIPMVVANVFMQQLVGAGRLWWQLLLHLPMVTVLALGFVVLIPRLQGVGYAIAVAASSVVMALSAAYAGSGRRAAIAPGSTLR